MNRGFKKLAHYSAKSRKVYKSIAIEKRMLLESATLENLVIITNALVLGGALGLSQLGIYAVHRIHLQDMESEVGKEKTREYALKLQDLTRPFLINKIIWGALRANREYLAQ